MSDERAGKVARASTRLALFQGAVREEFGPVHSFVPGRLLLLWDQGG